MPGDSIILIESLGNPIDPIKLREIPDFEELKYIIIPAENLQQENTDKEGRLTWFYRVFHRDNLSPKKKLDRH